MNLRKILMTSVFGILFASSSGNNITITKKLDLFDVWFNYYQHDKEALSRKLNKIYPRKYEYEKIAGEYSKPLNLNKDYLSRFLIAHECVESHGDLKAVSNEDAEGPRQFVPETQKYYFENNDFVNEVYDPIKAAYATMRFLSEFTKEFGSFDIALLAYNAGSFKMGKILKKCKKQGIEIRSYNDIPAKMLPEETLNYIYKIKALSALLINPANHGINLNYDPVFLAEYKTKSGDTLKSISKKYEKYGSSIKDIMDYNGIKHKSSVPSNYTLKIPLYYKTIAKSKP